MRGEQFLIITLTFGACHLLGKCIGYMAHRLRVPYPFLFMVYSAINMLSLVLMQIYHNKTLILTASLCVAQTMLAGCAVDIDMLSFDATFFTPTYLPISSGL